MERCGRDGNAAFGLGDFKSHILILLNGLLMARLKLKFLSLLPPYFFSYEYHGSLPCQKRVKKVVVNKVEY
jgi:hypothetical protein